MLSIINYNQAKQVNMQEADALWKSNSLSSLAIKGEVEDPWDGLIIPLAALPSSNLLSLTMASSSSSLS